MTSEHVLYRLFSATDELLYVGITNNTARRFAQHARKQSWWPDVASSRTELYRSREELEVAELTAIRVEKPTHNRSFNYSKVVSSSESAGPYVTVPLTATARDALRAAVIEFTSPVGRRISMSEVLLAVMKVSKRYPDELLADVLHEPPNSSSETPDSPAHALPTRAGRTSGEHRFKEHEMPLTRSRDLNSAPKLTEEEQKAREKAKRKFQMILDDAADEQEAVLITVLKDLGEKKFAENQPAVQGFLIRLIMLTGDHAGHVEAELPIYKRGFTNRIEKAGVGATMVSRLGRYGDRKTIGLEDDQDGDIELAEKAMVKFGDPFEDAAPARNGEGVVGDTSEIKARAKAKAAAEKDLEDPPF